MPREALEGARRLRRGAASVDPQKTENSRKTARKRKFQEFSKRKDVALRKAGTGGHRPGSRSNRPRRRRFAAREESISEGQGKSKRGSVITGAFKRDKFEGGDGGHATGASVPAVHD